MIVPMKKVSLVILSKDRRSSLEKLKELGVVHLEQLEGKGEKLAHFKEISGNAMVAESILGEIKLPKKTAAAAKLSDSELAETCREVLNLTEQKKKLLEEISSDSQELERFAQWGQVTPEDFAYLKEKNLCLKMYEIPEDKYGLIDENSKTLCVNRLRKTVRFLLVDAKDERPEDFPPEAYEVPLPDFSTTEIEGRIKKNQDEIQEIDKKITSLAVYLPQIKALKKSLSSDIEFETVYSGMAYETEGKESDLSWITGFVPEDCMSSLLKAAAENDWAVAYSDPDENDEVPTKLKNNKLVSLIYPLTDFLGTVPGYHEYDISGWFLLFFTVFFGMIFGDGGYGLLVTCVAILMILKSLFKKEKVSPLLQLVLLLGCSTVVWGGLTCTWFGLTPDKLPEWLTALSFAPISNACQDTWLPFWTEDASKGTLTTAQNLQIFCFTLGFLQLSVAHLKGMVRYIKSPKFLGEFGALLQIWGMYYVVLNMVVSSSIFGFGEIIYGVPVGKVSIGLVGFGFALSFIFSNYDGSVLVSILESCKNIISVLLGVVNVFSDIVSYIRLWAVGLAGSAISATVNEMAGPLVGHAILFAALVLLLVFGHGLNMILNLLSVIVHGVRLNTLEFSNHLGMSWSGFKYAPFSKTEK
ncbi:MAG: ATPase [Treponema sp.]|nr:ATPase [Treponema sp.]